MSEPIVRPVAPADAGAVADLCTACALALGEEPDTDAGDLLDEWRELDLERDAWLLALDGRLAGYACVYGTPEKLSTDGYVHPELRGRGIGSAVLALAEARAGELGAQRLQNAILHADDAAKELLEAHGYRFVRAFLRMGIDMDADPPPPSVPAGLSLERYAPGDAAAVHAAIQEAFADQWNFLPEDFDSWRARRLERADTTLWFVVRDGDEVVAVSVNDSRFGGGWIGSLGVRPGWRRRGLARALLVASFAEFRRRGIQRVALGVDSENPTGAVGLYEGVGMRTIWRADVYEKAL